MKLMVSACLLGHKVRYDGKDNLRSYDRLQVLINNKKVVYFCPEVAGDLTTPRAPAEISNQQNGFDVLQNNAQVISSAGENVSSQFISGAHKALEFASSHSVKVAILKARSPSCSSTLVYDGSFSKTLVEGMGVTAALLSLHGIKIFDEEHMDTAIDMFLQQVQ